MSRKNMKIPKGLTRSQKKRYVNQQIALAKGQEKMAKRINDFARRYAGILTKQSSGNEGVLNRLGFCPNCKMNYCFNYAGGISWCHECRINEGCLKLHYPNDTLLPQDDVIIRQCSPCRWEERDARELAQAILLVQTSLPQSRWREGGAHEMDKKSKMCNGTEMVSGLLARAGNPLVGTWNLRTVDPQASA